MGDEGLRGRYGIEGDKPWFKAICPQISAKISRANPVRVAPLEGF